MNGDADQLGGMKKTVRRRFRRVRMQVDEGIRFRLGISDGYGAGKAFICPG